MTEHIDPRVPQGGLSQVRGTTDVPLSDSTVHALLAAAARRWPERDAAVFVDQRVRFTWRQLLDEVEAAAAGLWALGVRQRRPRRHLVAEPAEWLLTQFATARIGADPGQHQPGVPARRARVRAEQGRLPRARHGGALQDRRTTSGCCRARARARRKRAAKVHARGCPSCVVSAWATTATPGMLNFADDGRAGARRARRPSSTRSARRSTADDPINIQFTSGTTGAPEGRDADAPQHRQQRALHRARRCASPRRRAVHPGAALPLLRHGAGVLALRGHGRDDGVPGRRLRRRARRWRRSPRSAAPRCTACRRCSSPSSTTPTSRASTCRRCAPASWPARPARSR